MVYRSMFDLTQQIPQFIATTLRDKLYEMNAHLINILKGRNNCRDEKELKDFFFQMKEMDGLRFREEILCF